MSTLIWFCEAAYIQSAYIINRISRINAIGKKQVDFDRKREGGNFVINRGPGTLNKSDRIGKALSSKFRPTYDMVPPD